MCLLHTSFKPSGVFSTPPSYLHVSSLHPLSAFLCPSTPLFFLLVSSLHLLSIPLCLLYTSFLPSCVLSTPPFYPPVSSIHLLSTSCVLSTPPVSSLHLLSTLLCLFCTSHLCSSLIWFKWINLWNLSLGQIQVGLFKISLPLDHLCDYCDETEMYLLKT